MATTWAGQLAAADQGWAVIVQIEGVGPGLSAGDHTASGNDARTRFCNSLPAYASGEPASLWRRCLAEFPDILSERAALFEGGVTELGSLTAELVDTDDYLTQTIRTDRAPTTYLDSAMTGTAGSGVTINVGSSAGMTATPPNNVIFIGSEALLVTAVPGGTSVTVTRGYLGTDPVPHSVQDMIYLSIPYLRNRRAALKVAPLDATSSAEAREVGQFAIDSLGWSDDLNNWILRARSQLKHLSRAAPIKRESLRVATVRSDQEITFRRVGDGYVSVADFQEWTGSQEDAANRFYLRNRGGEVVTVRRYSVGTISAAVGRRDVLRTGRASVEPEQMWDRVFVAETAVNGSFRYSPGPSPSTSRSSGTWTKTDSAAHLMLILMLSSAGDEDGLQLQNYMGSGSDFARSNYSSLPAGYGIGLPASQVDWDSWEDFHQRTAHIHFPHFVYGDAGMSFLELISLHFLKPLGAYLVTDSGYARIVLPRLALLGEATTTIGPSNVLTRRAGKRQRLPRIKVKRELAEHVSAIRYLVGPQKAARTFSDADFGATIGQRGYYGAADKPLEIVVPGGDPDRLDEQWAGRAAARLWRSRRPGTQLEADVDAGLWDLNPGDLALVTLAEMPELANSARGWTNVQAQVEEREVRINREDGAHIALAMRGWSGSTRIGRVSPAAIITGVASNTATVNANRYTETDAAGGLPVEDTELFDVADTLRLVNLDGSSASGTTQKVVSKTSTALELNGNFGGALASGRVLVFANYADCEVTQQNEFAFYADRAGQTVGAGAVAPYLYGEP